jgi:hypothetical protein
MEYFGGVRSTEDTEGVAGSRYISTLTAYLIEVRKSSAIRFETKHLKITNIDLSQHRTPIRTLSYINLNYL